MQFKFKYNEKEYILNEQNLEYFVNDEVNPIMDVNEEKIIEILNNSDKVDFSKAYFDSNVFFYLYIIRNKDNIYPCQQQK